MSFLRELIDEKSSLSTMRVLSIQAMLIAGAIALYGVYRGTDLLGVAAVSSVFVTGAFTGKVVQKSMENKEKDKP